MSHDRDEPEQEYVVLMNDEEQHSLWPAHKAIPNGWQRVSGPGSKSSCLEYVEQAWQDITPLSVRKRLGASS
jgi:MbtH protein